MATQEAKRLELRKASVQAREGSVPAWVDAGMGASIEQPARVCHLIQMLLGIFAAHGVLALGEKPARSVGDLLTQHLELLEAEERKKAVLARCWVSTLRESTSALFHATC